MAQHGPEPGTILNTSGVPTVPRQAATVIVLRGGSERLEVLMVQRTPKARFMGGAWVFPGGAVDAGEGEGDAAHRAAAVREVAEEAGLTLPDPAALAPFASADALLEWAASHEVRPVQPRVEGQGEAARIVLDDDDE